ncbi:MAG TPA: hypothetical protein VKV17_17900 [Bryobacteraceae bacterium]|nr:hypothetical protein [Bryobacteraceae bacterium]
MRDLHTTLSRPSIAVADSAAAALNVKASGSAVADLRPNDPFEVDLTDSAGNARFRKNSDLCGYVMCEELDQGDPGDLSGCRIVVGQHGDLTTLSACIGTHLLGCIQQPGSIAGFLASRETIWLEPGICLQYCGGEDPELRVMSGSHCFGMVRGRSLRALLEGLAYRLEPARCLRVGSLAPGRWTKVISIGEYRNRKAAAKWN